MIAANLPPCLGGKYRPLRQLGAGGMGTVFEVEHLHTGERLALKLSRANVRLDQGAVDRFMREARIAVRLKSEHVVHVVDADVAGELGGAPFVVMELLDGHDLGAAAGSVPQPPALVVEWLRQAAVVLDRAHAMGILHRDLKPENLFLTKNKNGEPLVKVLDFGVAKLFRRDEPFWAEGKGGAGTTAGEVCGTPLYMSPEQATKGEAVGPPSDLWSFAMVAFRLLAGEPYWGAATRAHVFAQIVYEPVVPPSVRGCDLGEAFDRWFLRSCHRDPASRWPSAAEQASALAEAIGHVREPCAKPLCGPAPSGGRPVPAGAGAERGTLNGFASRTDGPGGEGAGGFDRAGDAPSPEGGAPHAPSGAGASGGGAQKANLSSRGVAAALGRSHTAIAVASLLVGAVALASGGWLARSSARERRAPSLEGASWDVHAGGSGWHVQKGAWRVEGGALFGSGGRVISSAELADGTLELDYELVDGPGTTVGIGFRALPVLYDKDAGGYGANFRLGTNSFNVFRGKDGDWENNKFTRFIAEENLWQVVDPAYPDFYPSPAIGPEKNRVAVRALGGKFTIEVNGQPVGILEDDMYPSGRVTLWVNSPKATVRFSNIRITPL